jgi:hypothetical protein
MRRLSVGFVCFLPFLAIALAAPRDLRVPGVSQAVGAVVFALVCVAVGVLAARPINSGVGALRLNVVAGGLFLLPFALIALLWVGLGSPWAATASENHMRYLVLLAGSVSVTVGFFVLKESLGDAGERLWSPLGLGAAALGGAAYLVWTALYAAAWTEKARTGEMPVAFVSLADPLDVLLFVGCVLTYLSTAAFAAAMMRVRWLGRRTGLALAFLSVIGCLLVLMRGQSYPDPTAGSTPWFARPGFIAGIPAVPWILPYFIGAVLLRRAGIGRL